MTASFIVSKMDNSSLDRLLQQRREQSASALPGAFPQNVWREIRQRKAAHKSSEEGASIWHWLLQPQAVLAALVLAATVGVGVGGRPRVTPAVKAHEALDLQVFGGAASALPSTLLAEI